jgi:hypothetical protein
MPRAAALSVLVFGLMFAAGCGARTAPVEGVVVYADAPDTPATDLAGYVITFESDGADGKLASATGTVEADGKFRVSTFKEGDGALKGKQKVAITPPFTTDGARAPSKIAAKHHDLQTSGLEADIGPGTNQVKLTVERVGKKR